MIACSRRASSYVMIELIVTPSLYCFVQADDLDTDPVTDEEEEGEEEERDDDDDMYVTCEECGGVDGSPMSFDDGRGFICVFCRFPVEVPNAPITMFVNETAMGLMSGEHEDNEDDEEDDDSYDADEPLSKRPRLQ